MKKLTCKLVTVALIACASLKCEAQFDVLHSFVGTNGPGLGNNLTISGHKCFGMTYANGTNNLGCIFSIDTNGTSFKNLFNFKSDIISPYDSNTAWPTGSLTLIGSKLYGVALGGANGTGIMFSIDTNGSGWTDLFDFNQSFESPVGDLIPGGNKFFGMCVQTGSGVDSGFIYSINMNGTGFLILHNFNVTKGASPVGSLTLSAGVLYGMTQLGGVNRKGVIFSIDTNGSNYKDLLDFNGTNGANPDGSLIISGSLLYGMTYGGGKHQTGRIFSIKTDGSAYTSLFDFGAIYNSDTGSNPKGSLTLAGNKLYGMASGGGRHAIGTLFSINKTGTGFTDLVDFDMNTSPYLGSTPNASLTFAKGELYGMTTLGSGSGNAGNIFKLDTTIATGIAEISENNHIQVYPNPANDYINIRLLNSISATYVYLYNITGQQVMELKAEGKQTIQIATSNLVQGTYLLKVMFTDGSLVMSKVVIMK